MWKIPIYSVITKHTHTHTHRDSCWVTRITFPFPILEGGSCSERLFEMCVNMDSADAQKPQLLLINHHQAVQLTTEMAVPEGGIPAPAPAPAPTPPPHDRLEAWTHVQHLGRSVAKTEGTTSLDLCDQVQTLGWDPQIKQKEVPFGSSIYRIGYQHGGRGAAELQ